MYHVFSLLSLACLLVFLVLPYVSSYSQTDLLACDSCENGKITAIVDGDTVEINDRRVQLSLVDAPKRNDVRYDEATQFTSDLCPVNSIIFFDSDDLQPVDRHGRLVGVLYCDGVNLNESLLQNMLAYPAISYCSTSEFAESDWAKSFCFPSVTPDLALVASSSDGIINEESSFLSSEYLYVATLAILIPVIVIVIKLVSSKVGIVKKDSSKPSAKYVWYEMMPKSQEYDATAIMENLLTHLSDFALVVEKSMRMQLQGFDVVPEAATLRIYFRVMPADSHVLTSIKGYEFKQLEGKPPLEFISAHTLKTRNDFVYPLTTAVKECSIYDVATDMPNFLVGIVCKQIDGKKVIDSANKFIMRQKEEWTPTTKSVKEKAEQQRFFSTKIFFNTDEESIIPPINFMNKAEPNSLVRASLQSTSELMDLDAKFKSFGKQNVLSVPEIISILSLPADTRYLLVNYGHDDTFSSPGAVVDPAVQDMSYLDDEK